MSDTTESSGQHIDDLQFEHAEPAEPSHAALACAACKHEIADEYFEIGGHTFCGPCKDATAAGFRGGSKLARFLRAIALGLLASIAGAVIYYAVTKLTGINAALVSILVGFMIGGAVRKGSGHRGGWVYQLLAVFLTYVVIGVTFLALGLPDLMRAIANEHPGDAAAQMAIAITLSAVLVFTLPVNISMGAPISGLVFAFALWEAWKLNVRPRLVFQGPFRVGSHGDTELSENHPHD